MGSIPWGKILGKALEEFKTLFKPEIFILALVGIIALHCIYLH
jgi:hypothetical protein